MEIALIFEKLGIALGLGLLIGMQRERTANDLAGVRTFPLVTLLGGICALLAQSFGGWIIAAGLVALASIIILGNLARFREGILDPGLTTEVAILLMFGVGAYIVIGHAGVAIAVGGVAAVLLHFKGQLHGIVQRFGDDDLKAIMQFVLLSLVILPVLPDRAYGPYAVLNPRQVWWMVVLIVGISLSGYIVYRFFGEKVSAAVGGLLGGAISSTATTASYARLTATAPERSRVALSVITTASAVVFVRVLLEIAVVAPGFLPVAGPPLLIIFASCLLPAAGCWFWSVREKTFLPPQSNPSELRSALMFGFLYAVVILAIAAAKEHFGNEGLYAVAALSGMTDMDAITLSTSRLVGGGRLDPTQGWRLVVVALMSNLVFKAGAVAFLGHRRLALRVAVLYLALFACGALLLALWS
jgi:uncharacterized membrane protein (DUF4010 family)